jgi:transposase-like protein
MARAGRPRLLTPALIERLVAAVERGASLEAAAAEVGIGERSLRRWRAIGERELDGLSAEARLVLALDRAVPPKPPPEPTWEATAALLETLAPERWAIDDDLLGIEPS